MPLPVVSNYAERKREQLGMATVYIIRNWDSSFENSESRKRGRLYWLPVPIKHEGEHFMELMEQRNGVEIFGVWNLLIQLAAKCPKRGYLVKANGQPYDAKGIASRTRASLRAVKRGIAFLLARTDWLEVREMEDADVLKLIGEGAKEKPTRPGTVTVNEGLGRSPEASGFGTPEPDRAKVIERVRNARRESAWFIETEETFALTAQAIFGREWEQIGGWRKRYRDDAARVRAIWEEFGSQAMLDDSPIKKPGRYLNDLWREKRVGVKAA